MRASWVTLLAGICEIVAGPWLTSLSDLWRAENKLVQLSVAQSLGLNVPRTCVVGHRDLIPAVLGDRVVVKPLGPGAFTSEGGEPQAVFARLLDRDAPELETLGAAPFLVQEHLRAAAHLRIVTVDRRAWVSALDAPRELDWRQDNDAHHSFEPSGHYADVASDAVDMAHAIKVGYSSQDWIVTHDRGAFFLDLNPGGQWLFLPNPVATDATRAIASWLLEGI